MQRSTFILSLITVASLIGNALLYFGKPADRTTATTSANSSDNSAAIIPAASTPEAKIKDLEAQLKQAKDIIKRYDREQSKASSTTPAATAGAAASTVSKAKTDDLKEMLGSMMNDPALKDFAIQQQVAQLESKYAGLIDHLQLTPEEKSHFKRLISERITKEIQTGVQLMQPNLSLEQQKKIAQDISSIKESYDQSISQFLNDPNDFQTFKNWEASQPDRDMLQAGKVNFEAAGAPLSTEQESQLIALMTQARNNRYEGVPDIYNTEAMVGVKVDDGFISMLADKNRRDQQYILQQAPSFLNQQQVPALQKFLQDQARLFEATLKMSRQMAK